MFKEIHFGDHNVIVSVKFADDLSTEGFARAMEFIRLWNVGSKDAAIAIYAPK